MPSQEPRELAIAALKQAALQAPLRASVPCQIAQLMAKLTKGGKPYLEALLGDAGDQMVLRVWSDHPEYDAVSRLGQGAFIALTGDFEHSDYGVEARNWSALPLSDEAVERLLAGDDQLRRRQDADFSEIQRLIESLADPRFAAAARMFIERHGERLRRTAAARGYHHARRGGLVEHVAQMMRSADALCRVYPDLNRDLLLTGCLLHDCGKLFENCMLERGFEMPFTKIGELLGHIPAGIEMTNAIWLEACAALDGGDDLEPPSGDARLHLLHLIASHHGEHEFGSPTLPKTPEAIALHHIDNLDAKHEMMTAGLRTSPELAPGIRERVRPLPGRLVEPLAKFHQG